MKTFFKSLVLIAAAAFTLSACSQKENVEPSNPNDEITLKFNIRNADEATVTKALLGTEDGKNFLNWENEDKIGTFSIGSFGSGSSATTESKNNAGNVEVSGDDYTLNVQTFSAGTVTTIYSYFPYSSGAGKEKTAAVVTIPETQRMTDLGFDADAMPMAGEPVTVDLTTIANTDEPCGTINFNNLGSIIKFRVYTSTSTTETLTSVTYKANGVGGAFTIDLTGIDTNVETTLALTANETLNEITTLVVGNPAISDLDHAIDVYMVVAPDTYSGSQVVVTTNAHTYTLDASGDKTFTRSHVKPMKIDISKGTPGNLPTTETWTKVTSSADFTAGTYYILRADGAYYVPNATGNPSCVSYSDGDPITAAMKWTATTSGSGLQFESVSNAGYYLWTTNTGNANTISVAQTSTGGNASKVWSFATVSANNTTYYTATAGADKYLVSYQTSNWRYYATSNINANNIPAEFYKLDEVDNRLDCDIAWSEATGFAEISDEGIDYALPTLTNSQNLAVTYSSSDETVATISSTGVVSAHSAGETIISAIFAGNATYKPITVTYTLTVEDNSSHYSFTNVSELKALISSDEATFKGKLTNAVVSFAPDNKNAFIKDNTGSILYFTNDGHGLSQGQTFTGDVSVTAKLFNGLREITAFDGSFNDSSSSVSPAIVTLAQVVEDYDLYESAYVSISDLTVSSQSGKYINVTSGDNSYIVYDSTGSVSVNTNDIISAVGTITKFNTTLELKIW